MHIYIYIVCINISIICFWIKKEENKIGQVFAIRCGVTE